MERIPSELMSNTQESLDLNTLNKGILGALETIRSFKESEDLAQKIQDPLRRAVSLDSVAVNKFEAGLDYLYLLKESESTQNRIRMPKDKAIILKDIINTKFKTKSPQSEISSSFNDLVNLKQDPFSHRLSSESKQELIDFALSLQLFEEIEDLGMVTWSEKEQIESFQKIIKTKRASGVNANQDIEELKKLDTKIINPLDACQVLAFSAVSEFKAGIDFVDSLEESRKYADSIKSQNLKKDRSKAFCLVADAELKIDIDPKNSIESAKDAAEEIKNKYDQLIEYLRITYIEEKAKLDALTTFEHAETIISDIEQSKEKLEGLYEFGRVSIKLGLYKKTQEISDQILNIEGVIPSVEGKSFSTSLLVETFKEKSKSKDLIESDLQEVIQALKLIHNNDRRMRSLVPVADVLVKKQEFESAMKIISMSPSQNGDKFYILEKLAKAEADAGKYDVAEKTASMILGEMGKVRTLGHIALSKSKTGMSFKDIQDLDEKSIMALLSQNRDDIAYTLGHLRPDIIEKYENQLPEHVRNSLLLGKAEREKNKKKIYEVSSAVSIESEDVEKRAFARALNHLDYEIVSNQLLSKIRSEKDSSVQLRYLKTLIEMENPKGRHLATILYANSDLPLHHKEYLLRKLIDQEYWDKDLGSYLENKTKDGTSKEEIDSILSKIIGTLGLVPDKVTYEALETPGFLKGDSLEERLKEIEAFKSKFNNVSQEALLELFQEDEKNLKMFYLVNGGEYTYSLVNDYKFSKLKLIIEKINALQIDKKKISRFRTSLNEAGLSKKEVDYVLKELKEGRFPYTEDDRTVTFSTTVEEGSEYSNHIKRLQEVWSEELFKIIIASINKDHPENMEELDSLELESSVLENESSQIQKYKRLIDQFKIGEKQTQKSILNTVYIMKKELLQRAKQKNDSDLGNKLAELKDSEIIFEYLETFFPDIKDMGVYSLEWKSHLEEVLTGIEATEITKGSGLKTKEVEVELTFLDKGKDFLRAVRFADGQQCCFNSTNYNFGKRKGAADWIAQLYKDPLSFVTDIKISGSKQITGFVFGRMGINPETNKPIVMLNGIYSQQSGSVFVDNLLKIVEEKFARKIGADHMLLASKHGGRLNSIPSGYADVHKYFTAIRAIEGVDNIYDDIGQTANGKFGFNGLVKKLD